MSHDYFRYIGAEETLLRTGAVYRRSYERYFDLSDGIKNLLCNHPAICVAQTVMPFLVKWEPAFGDHVRIFGGTAMLIEPQAMISCPNGWKVRQRRFEISKDYEFRECDYETETSVVPCVGDDDEYGSYPPVLGVPPVSSAKLPLLGGSDEVWDDL